LVKNDPTTQRVSSTFESSVIKSSGLSGSELLENSLLSVGTGLSEFSKPFSTLGVFENSGISGSDNLLNWFLVSSFLYSLWVGDNRLVNLLVKILAGLGLSGGKAFLPSGELSGEFTWVFLLEGVHVDGNVVSENVISKDLSIECSLVFVGLDSFSSLSLDLFDLSLFVTWESLGVMWAVDTSITCSLHDSEDSGTGGGWGKSNIKEGLEGSLVLHIVINVEIFSVNGVVA